MSLSTFLASNSTADQVYLQTGTASWLQAYLMVNPDVLQAFITTDPGVLQAYLSADPPGLQPYLLANPNVLSQYLGSSPTVLQQFLVQEPAALVQYLVSSPTVLHASSGTSSLPEQQRGRPPRVLRRQSDCPLILPDSESVRPPSLLVEQPDGAPAVHRRGPDGAATVPGRHAGCIGAVLHGHRPVRHRRPDHGGGVPPGGRVARLPVHRRQQRRGAGLPERVPAAYVASTPSVQQAYVLADSPGVAAYFSANPAALKGYLSSSPALLEQYLATNPAAALENAGSLVPGSGGCRGGQRLHRGQLRRAGRLRGGPPERTWPCRPTAGRSRRSSPPIRAISRRT